MSYFKKGIAAGHGIAVGPMSEVVHDDLKHLTDGDLNAIVAYLKSTPPKKEEAASSLGVSDAAADFTSIIAPPAISSTDKGSKGKSPRLPTMEP